MRQLCVCGVDIEMLIFTRLSEAIGAASALWVWRADQLEKKVFGMQSYLSVYDRGSQVRGEGRSVLSEDPRVTLAHFFNIGGARSLPVTTTKSRRLDPEHQRQPISALHRPSASFYFVRTDLQWAHRHVPSLDVHRERETLTELKPLQLTSSAPDRGVDRSGGNEGTMRLSGTGGRMTGASVAP